MINYIVAIMICGNLSNGNPEWCFHWTDSENGNPKIFTSLEKCEERSIKLGGEIAMELSKEEDFDFTVSPSCVNVDQIVE